MQIVTIYQGEDVCQQCLGWKRVDDGEQQSWRYWEELPTQSQVAVKMGLVKPIVCPRCNGSGREPMSDTRKDFYNELVANLQSSSLAGILGWMAHHSQSVILNYGEDNQQWECSWILSSGDKRFTGVRGTPIEAVKDVLDLVREEMRYLRLEENKQ